MTHVLVKNKILFICSFVHFMLGKEVRFRKPIFYSSTQIIRNKK